MRSNTTLCTAVFCLDWEQWKHWHSQTPLLLNVKAVLCPETLNWLNVSQVPDLLLPAFDLFSFAIKRHFRKLVERKEKMMRHINKATLELRFTVHHMNLLSSWGKRGWGECFLTSCIPDNKIHGTCNLYRKFNWVTHIKCTVNAGAGCQCPYWRWSCLFTAITIITPKVVMIHTV